MGRRPQVMLALLVAALGNACAEGGPRIREVSFAPGRHVARTEGVRLELLHAVYDSRGVSLTLGVKNGGDSPVLIERDGILLAHADLEYPIATDPPPTIAATTTVPPQGEVQLSARFNLSFRLEDTATLRVRIARRGEDFIEGLAVSVPAGFAAADEEPPPEQP